MRVVAVGRGQREVGIETLPVAAGVAAAAAAGDRAGSLLESPPVVERVAAFHLVGARGGTPEEAGGEREWAYHARQASGFRRLAQTSLGRTRPCVEG